MSFILAVSAAKVSNCSSRAQASKHNFCMGDFCDLNKNRDYELGIPLECARLTGRLEVKIASAGAARGGQAGLAMTGMKTFLRVGLAVTGMKTFLPEAL
jgi:hypothetical protein